jgi:hypothetical protein
MRKTISLKLTSQEEDIISSMRKKGTSPSTIIREAFWNYVQQNEVKNGEKPYKEVNQVNHLNQEKINQDNRKDYKEVNQVNQKVNLEEDFLREKVVNQQVNRVDQQHDTFLEYYMYQLHIQIQHLENEINDWKTRYTTETQYWKDAYQSLQGEYYNHVKDSTKRIDEKFDRIMFYIEESRKTTVHNFEISKQGDISPEKQKKKWTSQMVRM